MWKRSVLLAGLLAAGVASQAGATGAGEKKYGPGASDTEIIIGQTMPYSGPASAYGVQGMVQQAYFRKVNEKGGINGRKIRLISLDDHYSPPKTVEQTRKLVESEHVLFIYGNVGTPSNTAIHKYLNGKKVPQVLISTGARKWNDLKNFPWTMAFYPSYDMEAHIFANHIMKTKPNAKIGILYQNDDFGRDYLAGFRDGLGDRLKDMVVAEASYEIADATVDSQIVKLKASGADTLFTITTPKFGAQTIRKVYELDWKPMHVIVSVSASIGGVLRHAGLDKSKGLITAIAYKTPHDPLWDKSPDMKEFIAFMEEVGLRERIIEGSAIIGYISAVQLHRMLERAGNNLTRENIMKMATSIDEPSLPMLLPGVAVKTTPDDVNAFRSLRLQTFNGESWALQDDLVGR
ncbi:ABC transporter substrate-binding protein [Camelimonas sp. ID_303_24]